MTRASLRCLATARTAAHDEALHLESAHEQHRQPSGDGVGQSRYPLAKGGGHLLPGAAGVGPEQIEDDGRQLVHVARDSPRSRRSWVSTTGRTREPVSASSQSRSAAAT